MKNNKNSQPVQGNQTDKKGTQNEGTEANPKREGNTPEKITPTENKKNDQTGDLNSQRENERPDKTKTPVANENGNGKNGQNGLNTPKSDLNEGPDSKKIIPDQKAKHLLQKKKMIWMLTWKKKEEI